MLVSRTDTLVFGDTNDKASNSRRHWLPVCELYLKRCSSFCNVGVLEAETPVRKPGLHCRGDSADSSGSLWMEVKKKKKSEQITCVCWNTHRAARKPEIIHTSRAHPHPCVRTHTQAVTSRGLTQQACHKSMGRIVSAS